jgi:16S rRNA processing protein RimM
MAKRPAPKYLQIGEILRPHGVHGELRMRVITAYPERIPDMKRVYLGEDPDDPRPRRFEIESVRFHQDIALITFKGLYDRDEADLLRGLSVMVALEDAVPLAEGEVYLFELIGMRVVTEEGEDLGEVADILEVGPSDTYLVSSEKYGQFTIPDVPQFIIRIDKANRQLVVRLMEGLLPDAR